MEPQKYNTHRHRLWWGEPGHVPTIIEKRLWFHQ